MKLKVTKTMTRYIDAFVKREKIGECAEFKLVRRFDYPGLASPDSEVDYDDDEDMYRVIRVYYPYDYYACPLDISTPMMHEALQLKGKGSALSESEFDEVLRDMIEI